MSFTVAGKNAMLDHLRTVATHVSLHNAAGTELSGGSPAYARKAITFGAAANGAIAASTQPVFDVPAGTTVKYVGFWSAVSGGTEYARGTVTEESYANQGTYTLTAANLNLNA